MNGCVTGESADQSQDWTDWMSWLEASESDNDNEMQLESAKGIKQDKPQRYWLHEGVYACVCAGWLVMAWCGVQ